MQPLVDALRAGGALGSLPTSAGSVASTALAVDDPTLAPGFALHLQLGAVTATLTGASVTASDDLSATVSVPLSGASLVLASAAGNVTLTAPAGGATTLTVAIGPAGVTWTVTGGPVALTPAPASLSLTGPGGATLALDLTTVSLTASAGELAIDVTVAVRIGGVPALPATTVPVNLHWDRHGFGEVGSGVATWAPGDLLPAAVDLTAPFTPPADPTGLGGLAGHGQLRARLTRAAGQAGFGLTVAVEAGDGGVLSSTKAEAAALAVLSTAVAAAAPAEGPAPGAALLSGLAAIALPFTQNPFKASGSVQITAVRFDVAQPHQARIDFHAELNCSIKAGFIDAGTTAPMRVAVRDALIEYANPLAPTVSFVGAHIDLAESGQWEVKSPKGLLQVAGVRSGHGSTWFELDLRFALDLGPVKVAGAVLRLTLDPGPSVSVRGFSVGVEVPGLLKGEGQLSLLDNGFAAALRISVKPLKLDAAASLIFEDAGGYNSILLDLALDLPAPVPLANSGLGLYGIGALIGLRRKPKGLAAGASIDERLQWQPDQAHTAADPVDQMFGAAVAIGTLPDLGYAFSAVGRVVVVTPDLSIRAALDASLLSGPRKVSDAPGAASTASIRGLLEVNPSEVYVGVEGQYHFPTAGDWELLRVDVPVEARFSIGGSHDDWFVHLGADGRSPRKTGPIQAHVLPGLFDMGSDAYLMIHGDGLTNLDHGAPPAGGFAIAAGFDFSTKYGAGPIWAEISVGATVVVASHPLFVFGHVGVGGSLHLGPFSLGVDAGLDLQIGPGATRYAKLELCGSIDLWFTEISGCVHLSFGNQVDAAIDPAPDPFLDATAADYQGANHSLPAPALTAAPAGAPAIWPDGVVVLGFAPGPRYTAAAAPAEVFRDGMVASAMHASSGAFGDPSAYHADYTLTSVTLDRLDEAGNATAITTQQRAAWQAPPSVPSPAPAGARNLALFSDDPALWAMHLTDGAVSDPADPVATHGRNCQGDYAATPGWAVGGLARPLGPGSWHLPAQVAGPATSLQSSVTADASTTFPIGGLLDAPLDPSFAGLLPAGTGLVTGGADPTTPVVLGALGEWPGWLDLPDVAQRLHDGRRQQATTHLAFPDPLVDGSLAMAPTLVLLVEDTGEVAVTSVDAGGVERKWFEHPPEPGPAGRMVLVCEWPASGDVAEATITHPFVFAGGDTVTPPLAIVAAGGITRSAADRATAAKAAAAAADAAAHKKATDPVAGPVGGPLDSAEGVTFRLNLAWHGEAAKGSKTATPAGDTVHRHFRIAEHVARAPEGPELFTSISTFHPAMLVRYLAGYTPDGSWPWFVNDAVCANLRSASAKTVADVYKYNLRLQVERTDPPPGMIKSNWALVHQLLDPKYLRADPVILESVVDLRGAAAFGEDCPWPHDAVHAAALATLEPDAAYDLAVILDPMPGDGPTRRILTSLPPGAFRTSRWLSPDDMAGALTSAPVHRLCRAAPGVPAESTDGALAAALETAGAPLTPLDGPARTTVLWAPAPGGAGWTVAAVLFECVEPLVRGERMANLRLTAPAGAFALATDTARTAALFVAPAGVGPGALTLGWDEKKLDVAAGAWVARVGGMATLAVPDPSTLTTIAWEVAP